jgi:undecaprenyl-diphosphatase
VTGLQAAVLGVVQGATEFLPVSSSGHLLLVPVVLGWPDQGVAFDAAVHLGTALALLVYFGRDLGRLTAGALAGRAGDWRVIGAVVLGSLPAVLAGLLLESFVESRLRSPLVVAASLVGWGLVLGWADRRGEHGRVRDLEAVGLARALLVGCAQALALVPGTSRSGITLTAGLLGGLDRPTAARFAFLLGLPLTAGAGALKTAELLRDGVAGAEALPLVVGIAASFAAGLAAVWFLLRYLRTRTLRPFVVYRVLLGLLVAVLVVGS